MTKALVLGCGSIGIRHIGHLLQLGIKDLEAADPDPAASQRARQQFGIAVSLDHQDALRKQPDIVLVCTPAHLHVPVAMDALEAGAHVFIEKPLSTSLDGVADLIERSRALGKTVQVGYNLRYHPAIKSIKHLVQSGNLGNILSAHAEFGLYLEKWWPGRDYRQSYMAHSGQGGGLLMDASHEIDSLLWFLGGVEQVAGFSGKLSALEIDGDDTLKVTMKMKSGAIASLHLDCLQPTYTRMYSLIGEDTRLTWDCPKGRADTSLGRLLLFDRDSDRFKRVSMKGRPEDTYVEELRDFLRCVSTGQPPLVGLDEGIEVLRVIKSIEQAVQTGQEVAV
jgi:predicted dehydrogenase